MVEGMKEGSVILDLAAEGGGNCELTQIDQTITHQGVKISGPVNVPSKVSTHASELYAKNLQNFLELLIQDGQLVIDLEDEIIRDSMLTHKGEITNEALKEKLNDSNDNSTAEGAVS